MSIPTVSTNANPGLQPSQKAMSPVAASSMQRTALATRSTSVSDPVSKTLAAKAATDAKEEVKLDARQVQQSLEEINKLMTGLSISVQFRIDPNYKELIVKVVDQDTGKLIRQIPTEEAVKISKEMDNLKGLLFAKSA